MHKNLKKMTNKFRKILYKLINLISPLTAGVLGVWVAKLLGTPLGSRTIKRSNLQGKKPVLGNYGVRIQNFKIICIEYATISWR